MKKRYSLMQDILETCLKLYKFNGSFQLVFISSLSVAYVPSYFFSTVTLDVALICNNDFRGSSGPCLVLIQL